MGGGQNLMLKTESPAGGKKEQKIAPVSMNDIQTGSTNTHSMSIYKTQIKINIH